MYAYTPAKLLAGRPLLPIKTSMKQSNNPELIKDRLFNPWRRAFTDKAKSFVNVINDQYCVYESKTAPRKRARREKDQAIFDLQLEALATDLAYEHIVHPKRWLTTSLSKSKLSNEGRYGAKILNNTYPLVVRTFCSDELGFAQYQHGSKFDWDNDGRTQTRFIASERLIQLISDYGLSADDFREINDGEVIILKSSQESIHDKKELVRYKDTATSNKYRSEVITINQWLQKAQIEYEEYHTGRFADQNNRHLRRIFNNGSFEQGGRLFGGFWQFLPKEDRKKSIFINGAETITLDFGQIAPRIMYGMAQTQPVFDDAYYLPDIDPKYRDGIKKIFNTLLCADKRPTRFPMGTRELIPDTRISIDQIVNGILEAHFPIAHLFFSGIGLSVMFQESQIMVDILLELINRGITALPIHDALIIEEDREYIVREVMTQTFLKHTGVSIQVSRDT